MLVLAPVVDWLNALDLPLPIKFTEGPEEPEFGNHLLVGTVTLVPGGAGETHQGAFEEEQVLVLVRGRREKRAQLVASARALDKQLRLIENSLIWGTYVRYVFRQGSLSTSFEEPDRDRVIGNYLVHTGD